MISVVGLVVSLKQNGIITSFLAELWTLRDGLLVCQDFLITAIKIELDAKAIVNLLANPNHSNSVISSLVANCRFLVQ